MTKPPIEDHYDIAAIIRERDEAIQARDNMERTKNEQNEAAYRDGCDMAFDADNYFPDEWWLKSAAFKNSQ